jgi:hypothetical protein
MNQMYQTSDLSENKSKEKILRIIPKKAEKMGFYNNVPKPPLYEIILHTDKTHTKPPESL